MENIFRIQIYTITFRNPMIITVAALCSDVINFTLGLRNFMGTT